MNLGEFKHRVSIFKKITEEDEQGGRNETLQLLDTFWAYVEPLKVNEQFEALKNSFKTMYQVIIKTNMEIQPQMILECENKQMEIKSVLTQQSYSHDVVLICEEI